MTEFELINKLNQKYESKKELERLFKQTRNYEMLIDLENYNDFSKKDKWKIPCLNYRNSFNLRISYLKPT